MSLSFANERFSFALSLFGKRVYLAIRQIELYYRGKQRETATNTARTHHRMCASLFFFPLLSPPPASPPPRTAPLLSSWLVMVVQIWEYAKKHWIIYFTWMTWLVHKLYLNKSVIYIFLKCPLNPQYDYSLKCILMNRFTILKCIIHLWYIR